MNGEFDGRGGRQRSVGSEAIESAGSRILDGMAMDRKPAVSA